MRASRIAAGATVAGVLLAGTATPALAARLPISSSVAKAAVTASAPGDIVGVRKAARDGLASWAITVRRADGSVVVGYVSRKSGVVFDWTVQQAPTEPVLDLDGADGGRTAAPVPPAPGDPLPPTATVDPASAIQPTTPAVTPTPAPVVPSPTPTSDVDDHADDSGSDDADDHADDHESDHEDHDESGSSDDD